VANLVDDSQGNDDQAFWAFAAMSAAEMKFPSPGPNQPSWLSLAQAVFNRQANRWDDKHCSGGLRWQFNWLNPGWMNKNTISNGCFFQLAARLAKYTNNDTYANWAEKTYEWMTEKSPLISKNFEVFDSIGFTETTCDDTPGMIQWTYNIGTVMAGCAFVSYPISPHTRRLLTTCRCITTYAECHPTQMAIILTNSRQMARRSGRTEFRVTSITPRDYSFLQMAATLWSSMHVRA
jgi:predicted alpha-1,6-mannanase (GH76 family)